MKIGIVGSGADKFTESLERRARKLIEEILTNDERTYLVSGHSPVGGIDIWAEEIADEFHIPKLIHAPEVNQWSPPGQYGYRARNLDIARDSDVLHVIVAMSYPPEFRGMRFPACYHCKTDTHVKSGGCWTGHQARKMGKEVIWHVLGDAMDEEDEALRGIAP